MGKREAYELAEAAAHRGNLVAAQQLFRLGESIRRFEWLDEDTSRARASALNAMEEAR